MRFVVPVRSPQSYAGRLAFFLGSLLGTLTGALIVGGTVSTWLLDTLTQSYPLISLVSSHWYRVTAWISEYPHFVFLILVLWSAILAYFLPLTGRNWERFLEFIIGISFISAASVSLTAVKVSRDLLGYVSQDPFPAWGIPFIGGQMSIFFFVGASWLTFCVSFAWWHELRQEAIIQGGDDIRPIAEDDGRTRRRRRCLVERVAAGGAPLTSFGLQFLFLPVGCYALMMGAFGFYGYRSQPIERELNFRLLSTFENKDGHSELHVRIAAEGDVFLDVACVGLPSERDLPKLTDILENEMGTIGQPYVILEISQDAKHERIIDVLSTIQRAHIETVYLPDLK